MFFLQKELLKNSGVELQTHYLIHPFLTSTLQKRSFIFYKLGICVKQLTGLVCNNFSLQPQNYWGEGNARKHLHECVATAWEDSPVLWARLYNFHAHFCSLICSHLRSPFVHICDVHSWRSFFCCGLTAKPPFSCQQIFRRWLCQTNPCLL